MAILGQGLEKRAAKVLSNGKLLSFVRSGRVFKKGALEAFEKGAGKRIAEFEEGLAALVTFCQGSVVLRALVLVLLYLFLASLT